MSKANLIDRIVISFRRWINTPPDETDLFFVKLRKATQFLSPCKHGWEELDYKRKCKWCGKKEILVWRRYGKDVRVLWR